MTQKKLLLGQTFQVSGNPMRDPWQDTVTINNAGGVLIEDGMITQVGDAAHLRQAHPQASVTDYGNHLICPGFIDAHVHYPQTAMIASWGKQLIDWLNTYTFPEEMRLSDPRYARLIAERYFELTLAQGTTTVCSYATIHPQSVDAFFEAAQSHGVRSLAGKTCMDRNAPDGLRDTAQSAYDDSKALLKRWHGCGRAQYAITPRFSPTSTHEQLAAMGALWAEHPDCLMQTHLSEQTPEIEWVHSLFPEARDYLDTYETHGLLGSRAVFGHAIYLEAREIDRIAETGASLVHCPTSNSFIGSGLMDVAGLAARNIPVGLATDTGGGSSFSMLRTMAAAYEIAQLRGTALHPAQLMYLATAGSARSLHLQDTIGTLASGFEADMTILDLFSTPAISQRADQATTVWEALFPTIMMGDDRAIADVWIAGKRRI
ncbi:MAG: guanine deaminase [Roseobacter sp.]